MIVILKKDASAADIAMVVSRVEKLGYEAHLSTGEERTIIGLIGGKRPIDKTQFEVLEPVERAVHVMHPYKLASRDMHPAGTVVALNGFKLGGEKIGIIAGPCAVESHEQFLETAWAVKEAGATALRGGIFKPRTSPYSFQGMQEDGLEIISEAYEATGLPVVTEALSPEQVPLVAKHAAMIQIGARNMQNYALLHAAGQSGHPVLLKRGMMATIEEWLMAAEHILSNGNPHVVLCERGIRTFERATRNSTDISSIPVVKQASHLPVVLDPSHSTGRHNYVAAVARAGIAAGADGLIIEVHPRPAEALSDGAQSLKPEKFARLVEESRAIAAAIGRNI